MGKTASASLMLGVVVVFWGFSYVMVDIVSEDLGPFTLCAYRFILAFLIAGLIFIRRMKKISRATLLWSLPLGLILTVVFTSVNIGVANTKLSNSAFLCQLTVIVTPFLSAAVNRTRLPLRTYIASFMCMAGIAMMTLTDGFTINKDNLYGDLFCMLCGVAYAVHIVAVERAVRNKKVDPLQLGILQLGTTAAFSLVLAFLFEKPHLPSTPLNWTLCLVLAVCCTGLSFVVQTLAQQYVPAGNVSIILSLEPVIAALAAYFIAGDRLSPRALGGAILMFAAIIAAQMDFKVLRSRLKR